MMSIPLVSEQLQYGGQFEGGIAAGHVDMGAASTGEYIYGEGNGSWHKKISTHAYAWFIIAGALAILWVGGAVVFKDINA